MRPAVVLVVADGPSPVDPHSGRRRYDGGYLSQLLSREAGVWPVALSGVSACQGMTCDHVRALVDRFDAVAVGSQPKNPLEKMIAEEANHTLGGPENVEAWLRDRRSK